MRLACRDGCHCAVAVLASAGTVSCPKTRRRFFFPFIILRNLEILRRRGFVKDGPPKCKFWNRDDAIEQLLSSIESTHTWNRRTDERAVECGRRRMILVFAATPERIPFGASTIFLRLALCNMFPGGVASPATPDVPADRPSAESGQVKVL